jgi:hypothetical protein
MGFSRQRHPVRVLLVEHDEPFARTIHVMAAPSRTLSVRPARAAHGGRRMGAAT